MKTYNFYSLLIFFISLLFAILLVFPQYQNWFLSSKSVKELEKALKVQNEYFQELKQIAANLEKYQPILSKIDTALPSNPSLPELLNFVQKSAQNNGLLLKEVESIKIEQVPNTTLKKTEIELTLSGEYPAFKNFLANLETSARIIGIENILFFSPIEEVRKPEKEPKLFEFNLKIKVHHS